jgi:hypothetical protein
VIARSREKFPKMWTTGSERSLTFTLRRAGFLGKLLYALVWLLVLLKICSFLYFTAFKAGYGEASSSLTNEDPSKAPEWFYTTDKSVEASRQQWHSIWGTHAAALMKMTRLKGLLDSQRRILKPEPDKEYQHTAGLDVLLAQALSDVESVSGLSKLQAWIKEDVTRHVELALEKLQFPEDCNGAKKLVCDLNKECGFGCQVHHVVHCFANAVALNRTMLLKVSRMCSSLLIAKPYALETDSFLNFGAIAVALNGTTALKMGPRRSR